MKCYLDVEIARVLSLNHFLIIFDDQIDFLFEILRYK